MFVCTMDIFEGTKGQLFDFKRLAEDFGDPRIYVFKGAKVNDFVEMLIHSGYNDPIVRTRKFIYPTMIADIFRDIHDSGSKEVILSGSHVIKGTVEHITYMGVRVHVLGFEHPKSLRKMEYEYTDLEKYIIKGK